MVEGGFTARATCTVAETCVVIRLSASLSPLGLAKLKPVLWRAVSSKLSLLRGLIGDRLHQENCGKIASLQRRLDSNLAAEQTQWNGVCFDFQVGFLFVCSGGGGGGEHRLHQHDQVYSIMS